MNFPNRDKKMLCDLPETVQTEFQKTFDADPRQIEVLNLVESGRSETEWQRLGARDFRLSPWRIYRKV